MSKKMFGVILVICGILAFHLLGSEPETRAIWSAQIDEKIYSDPVSLANRYVFLGGNKGRREYFLYEIDSLGQQTARSVKLPVLGYQPIVCGNIAVVADKSNMIRGFNVPGLGIAWEAGLEQQIMIEPARVSEKNIVLASGKSAMFCLDGETGQPIWDYQFSKPLINFAADQVVISISGYTDLKVPAWQMSGHDPETGEILWSSEENVSSDKPLFVQDLVITTSESGQLLVLDQNSGQLLFKHQADGLKAVQVLGDRVIMLAAGGSRIVCFSLMNGDSWTTTLNSGFTGAARNGNRLILATKKTLRCVEAANGGLFWTRELGDVYNAFPFRNGIFLTHKDSFFDRSTYGSYISTKAANSVWTAYGRSIFLKPLVTTKGDLVVSYNGLVKMLPAPPSESSSDLVMPNMPDPEQKIRQSLAASATKVIDSAKPAADKETAPDKKETQPELEIKDSGWTNEKP